MSVDFDKLASIPGMSLEPRRSRAALALLDDFQREPPLSTLPSRSVSGDRLRPSTRLFVQVRKAYLGCSPDQSRIIDLIK